MNFSSSTKKAIAASLLIGSAALVALLGRSSTETSFIPSLRNLEEGGQEGGGVLGGQEGGGVLSAFSGGFKPTGFYTGDIGFLTVKPWGPATWSVDFTTKSVKKLNELLFSADGEENRKGSILCTDELCQGHGKATTAFLIGADNCLTSFLEIGADAFEVCYTCPPDTTASLPDFTAGPPDPTADNSYCTTDVATGTPASTDCQLIPVIIQLGRTACVQYRNPEEPMPNIVAMQLKLTCTPN